MRAQTQTRKEGKPLILPVRPALRHPIDSKDKKQQYADFNANAKDSILMGFVFDRTKVEAEYQACNAVKAEYQKLVEMGFMGEEGLQEYADALDGAGVQVVLDELNAQLAEFFAAK